MATHPFDSLIASLPRDTTKALGDAFEKVAMWFLRTDPEYRLLVKQVWLWDEWDGRWGTDTGIDLVVEDFDGELWAVQAKGYAADGSLSYGDLATFFSACSRRFTLDGIERQFAMGLLISSAETLGAKALDHMGSSSVPIALAMRDRLRSSDVEWPATIEAIASNRAAERPKPKGPRPHQAQAIRDTVACLADNDRAQLLMACGTGKTLTAMWIAEDLQAERILILVPSLALVRQTLGAWSQNASTSFRLLTVCSDDTVATGDELRFGRAELGVPTTTDPAVINRFMSAPGRQVVISTYQSSDVLRAAQSLGAPRFDLMLCDEAHRMTGPASGPFAQALDDEVIGANKRLHMTATPRTFTANVRKQAAAADTEIASMDDEEKFGPVAHRLTFGQAIADGLLSDYQVLIIGVTDGQVAEMANEGTFIQHAARDARTLSAQVGLLRAMAREDLRRVITFHSAVATAKRFAKMLPETAEWLGERAPDGVIVGEHVSGEMTTGERERHIRRLRDPRDGERVVVTNARCLTEGVDVPAIDGVGFIDPKSSEIDIAQAVGRAIRKSGDKIGTIVLPVLVPEGADSDEVLSDSAFRHVWSVIRALRAHDEALGEELDSIRRSLGSRTVSAKVPGKIVIDLPVGVPEGFGKALEAKIVDSTTASWEEWFGLLEEWVHEHGSARPPQDCVYGDKQLGQWVSVQRREYNRGRISPERSRRLETLVGWDWDPFTTAWDQMLECLREWVTLQGPAHAIPWNQVYRGENLGDWVIKQRKARSKGRLSPSRMARLEQIPGWTWRAKSEDAWEASIAAVRAWVELHGHGRVPLGAHHDGKRIGTWVARQRRAYRQGNLSHSRVSQLEAITGWTWEPHGASWAEHIELVEQWAGEHGHVRIPSSTVYGGKRLGAWLQDQRTAYRRGTMSVERVRRMEQLPGWAWNTRDASWLQHLELVLEWVNLNGTARIPDGLVHGDKRIGAWVANQRTAYRRGTLSDERIALLESVPGWLWRASDRPSAST